MFLKVSHDFFYRKSKYLLSLPGQFWYTFSWQEMSREKVLKWNQLEKFDQDGWMVGLCSDPLV